MKRKLARRTALLVLFMAAFAGGTAPAQEARQNAVGPIPPSSPKSNIVFLSAPEGGTFQEGNSLSWTVLVEGATGTPTYQWVKDSVPVQGKTENTFRIDSLQVEDAGWYTCKVTDGNGAVMTTEAVQVKVKELNAIPAAGGAALMAAAALCVLFSTRRLRPRA